MKIRCFLGTGLAMCVVGCAGQGKPRSSLSTRVKPVSSQPVEDSTHWEATNTPADLLAQKTDAFSRKLQTDSPDSNGTAVDTDPFRASTDQPGRRRGRSQTPIAAAPIESPQNPAASGHSAPVNPAPADQPGASSPANPALASSIGDGPRILPESADFSSSTTTSKDELGTRLRKRTRENPMDIADQLDLQLYGMLNDDPSPELASVTQLPTDDRELVAALIDGLSNFRSTVREDSNVLASKKIQPLLEMADRLRSQAGLTVTNAALCRRVDGFGKYEPITPQRFPAMQENPAILYFEIENFLTKQQGSMWTTKLTEQVSLYSDTGVLAWSDEKREVSDECRNRRHDFFAYVKIKLPAALTVGRYMLKVSVEDQNTQPPRVDEASVPLEIVGK